jgi:Mitotic checkpoint regulator, MAD2B-interacting
MKLVDYSDSDSDSSPSDDERTSPPPAPKPQHATLPKPKKQILVDLPKPSRGEDEEPSKKRPQPAGGGGGLFAMLPPPKRSKPTVNGAANEPEVKDGADGEKDTTTANPLAPPPTAFAPRSTHTKKGKPIQQNAPPPSTPRISLFPMGPDLLSKPLPFQQSNPLTYEPLIAQPISPPLESYPSFNSFIPDTTAPPPPPSTISTADLDTFAAHILEGRHRKARTVEIMDYNAADIYAQNAADKASGLLQEQVQPVRAIGGGRHQLTQLLNNVQQQKESLEEQFAAGRRVKKESAAKYGW